MASLSLRGLSKSFGGGLAAVREVSLDVRDGETVAVLGPSGCGKSTLLRLVAGLERPDAGSIRIGDRSVDGLEPRDRDVAMVFQSYALYPHFTVFDNVAAALRLRGMTAEVVREKVEAAARSLGIDGLLSRRPGELSGGERQRVAVARAIVREPAVFLLDEPLSNLDALLRERARAELKALFRRVRGTVVYVTHDQVEAMTLSDRVAVLRAGRLEQCGTPEEVYSRPATVFVAEFVGTPRMNLLPGPAVGIAAASIGIRPEDVQVGDTGPMTLEVVLRESLGSQQLLTLRSGDLELRALLPSARNVPERAAVTLDPARIHRFDADGNRLE